jgi:hypothetical protein
MSSFIAMMISYFLQFVPRVVKALEVVEVRVVGACRGGAQTRKFASGREAAFAWFY